ncbi:MAG: DNA polymerase III subunit chi [Pseudomonadota bacterium]
MSEIAFYHLERASIAQALPRLLEKVLSAGHRALVQVGSPTAAAALDSALWTYDPASFLPHGMAGQGHEAAQPIYITAGEEAPNGATVAVIVDGRLPSDLNKMERYLYMFEGADAMALKKARAQWRTLKEAGHALTYWQQTENGGWEKKA